jgi:hypothetical protein
MARKSRFSIVLSQFAVRDETVRGYSRWFKTIRSVTIDKTHQVIQETICPHGPNTKGGCSALDKSKADTQAIMTNNLIYTGFLHGGDLSRCVMY